MAIAVKICGMTTDAGVDAALAAGADYIGLVFHPASPRHLQLPQAAALAGRARGRVRIAALTADADDAALEAIRGAVRPDFFQLHGQESPARADAIRSRFATPVMKALAVAEAADFAPVAAFEQVCEMLLFDAKAPSGANRPGGLGAAFDWRLLQGRKFARPWLLAGGLNAGNIAAAIATSGAQGVDVSSGVESAPGVKDPALIRAFVSAARGAIPQTAHPADGEFSRD